MAYVAFTWTTTESLSIEHFNHAETQYAEIVAQVATVLAPSASPAFTGTPTKPTPEVTANDYRIATCAFVEDVLQFVL